MNSLKKMMVLGASVALAAGLIACDKSGPAETAGKKLDEATEKAEQKLGEAAEMLGQKGEQMGAVMDDSATTAKVKSAILAESVLQSLQIGVDTQQGKVTLTGSADSQMSSDKAKKVASAVSGVTSVDNQIAINAAK